MSQGLAALRQRKKELLLESDINRQILRVELCQLQTKAMEWRRNLLKIRNAYKWIAPVAGVGFGIYSVRKKLRGIAGAKRNGQARGKSDLLKLLAPIGFAVLRKALGYWRNTRNGDGRTTNGAT